jgi:murein DD-endopeptidase MepM/ murein hydrolase activator NlpD
MTPALAAAPSRADPPAGGLPARRRRPLPARLARRSAALVLGTLLLPAPTGAAADTPPPGSAVPASPPTVVPPATPPSAAAAAVGRPVAGAITCRTACLGLSTAKPGATVRVTGDGAGAATSLVFLGRRGRRDDVVAAAQPVGPTAVEATLPARVRSGPVRLITADGRRSTRSARRLRVGAPSRSAPIAVRVAGRRVFVDATRRATLDVFVGGTAPADVAVDLVRDTDGAAVAQWTLPGVPGGTVQSVEWDGTSAGAPQPEGRYVFRTSVISSALRTTATPAGAASTTAPGQAASFVLVRSVFPVVGRHGYGEGAARFGAGRSGHAHQGQDVFAPCGTPVVAAHAGVVKVAEFEARAGNHLIVAAEGGVDQVYMHLRDAALVAEGAPVATGQPIGFVGDTGDAQGCHLHFEIWPAPGWAAGGSPVDPLPSLEAWDTD